MFSLLVIDALLTNEATTNQTDMAYSDKLNTAYRSPDITAETDSSYLISVLDFLYYLSSELILLIVYPLFQVVHDKSSTKELFTPFKNLEREFRSSRKLFKTPSLDESSSPEVDLFSYLEEHFKEEVPGLMTETIKEYMCKTRGDYGSGVTRPKIDAKGHFELKGQFLKELRDNTFSGSDHEDANEHIDKVLETEVILTRSTKTSDGLAAIQAQLNNLGREIKKVNEKVYAAQVGCELSSADLGASVSVVPLSTYLNLGLGELAHTKLNVKLADKTVKHPKGFAENVLVGIGKFVFPINFIILDIPEDINVPLILGRPFLSTAHTKVDVFKRKITLRVGYEKIIFNSVKPAGSIIKKVYMLGLRERMDLDLKARIIGETLIMNRSFNPLYGDYIELNDLNEPIELRRNINDDLEPSIKEGGEVVNEPMVDLVKTRCDFIDGLNDYPSYCDYERKIHVNCAYNLKFSCMIGFEHVSVNFVPNLSINIMSRKFYKSIMKDKIDYKGKNVVKTFMNVPVFVGNFCVVTNFAVLENMDIYQDKHMGDVIIGKPFCKVSCVEVRRFDGLITIYNGDDIMTYQMVSAQDELNGITHSYQKLKTFYKGFLDLRPVYNQYEKIVEKLTHGHISVHEIE
ncbi:homeodomain-like protein [Tanacetum coccineum]